MAIWPFRKKREPPYVPTLAEMRALYVVFLPVAGAPAPLDVRAEVLARTAGALVDGGKFEHALHVAELAIDEDPKTPSAYSNRGAAQACERLGPSSSLSNSWRLSTRVCGSASSPCSSAS